MCSVVVEIGGAWPLCLAFLRDEDERRRWRAPAAHWADPSFLGGYDIQGGGSWLVVEREKEEVAFVLNARGEARRERRTRGELPLLALREEVSDLDLSHYDGFILGVGSAQGVCVWEWDGERLTQSQVRRGVHHVWNGGVDAPSLRSERFRERILEAGSPRPTPGERSGWEGWMEVLRGEDASKGPAALLWKRREGWWSTTSATLVGVGEGVSYLFSSDPARGVWDVVV